MIAHVCAAEVCDAAERLLGTPFHHQGRWPGLGLDCAGVPIAVARWLGLVAPDFDITGYGPMPDGRTLKRWCDRCMLQIGGPEVGSVVLVAWRDGPPQHLGIVVPGRHGADMIHADSIRHREVVRTRLHFGRAMRLVQAYRLPGVQPPAAARRLAA